MELGAFSISLAVKDIEASRKFYEKFGFNAFAGAYQMMSLPPQLKMVQRGQDRGHFEIVPTQPMTMETHTELLNQVVLKLLAP